ncbi:MAG: hypothetical protein NC300_10050 [Bacteroidales bacterium]|nr:hypothetical protein [Clostridium sp.]MCM1204472.1 hypothetical protein [Bacteroidales bacterium]
MKNMTQFTIKIPEINSSSENLGETAKELKFLEERFTLVSNEIKQNEVYNLQKFLNKVSDELREEQSKIEKLSDVLKRISHLYVNTEQEIQKLQLNKNNNKTNDNNSDTEEETLALDYFDIMSEYYGFSEEDAKAIKEAYEAFADSDISKGLNNKEKINLFFSNMASLFSQYSGDSKLFKMMGDNPTQSDAVKFFNDLGVDGNALKEIVTNQHNNCERNRDFAHECAIYSVMANKNLLKAAANKFDNVDELVGFKGDIYSKSMGIDDIKSDIAAVNIYNRMLNSSDGDVFSAFTEYNKGCADGTINESREFLEYYGNGDAEKGMKNLTNRIDDTSIGTWYLSGEYGGYGGYGTAPYSYSGYSGYGYQEYGYLSGNTGTTIEDCKNSFLDYLREESGVSD